MAESTSPVEEILKKVTVSDQPESSGDQLAPNRRQKAGEGVPPLNEQPDSGADPTVPLDYDPKVAMEQAKAASDFKVLPVNAQVAVAGDDKEKKAAAKELADNLNAELVDKPAFQTEWKEGDPQNKPGVKLSSTPTNVLIM